MLQDNTRIGIYTRVSTAEQASDGWSIEGQYNDIRAHVTKNSNWSVVRSYTDNGASGATLDRPGIQKMLLHAKSHLFDVLAVWRFDRLSRDNQDFQVILHYLNTLGIKILSINEPTPDYNTPYGEFTIGLLGLMSTLERKVMKMRTRMGQRTRVEKGLHHGGLAPYGYTYDKVSGKLSIDDKPAKNVRTIFEKYIEYQSLNQVSLYLQDRNIPTPKGKTKWKSRVLSFLLQRETYLGFYISNEVKVRDQTIQIIDEKTFNRAKAILNERKHLSPNSEGQYSKMHLLEIDGQAFDDLANNPFLQSYVKSKIDMPSCPECHENFKVRCDSGYRTENGAYIPHYFCNQCRRKFHAPYSIITSKLYYPPCPRCGEKDQIKPHGKERRSGGKIYQKYNCTSCNHWFKIEEDNQEFMDAIRKIAHGIRPIK